MHSILRDVSYGLRLFRRNPTFSILAALILALGIGANTAIFSLIHAVILNPLPYKNPGNLCVLWSDFSKSGGNRRAFSAPGNYFDWRDRNSSFQSLTAYALANRTFTALDQPITPLTHEVTASPRTAPARQACRTRHTRRLANEDPHPPAAVRAGLRAYLAWPVDSTSFSTLLLLTNRGQQSHEAVQVFGL
jgi:hypothetical protein